MVRVLEAISDTNVGGAGILLATKCLHRDRSQYDVLVVIPKNSQLKKRLQESDVRVVEIDGCYDRSWDPASIPKWISILRSFRPHLVNCHSCFSCRVAARICRVPVLLDTRHCAYPPRKWMTVFPGKAICGCILRSFSDQTIAVAQAAKQNLIDIGGDSDQIQVIVNGAEGLKRLSEKERELYRDRLGFPTDGFVVGIFARLEPCKDHETFLQAAGILIKQNEKYRFLIVGDGSQKKYLEQYAKALGIFEYVRFIGFVSNVTPYFNITDIHVNCSVGTETSSLALSEGMSLGIPSVASDYGGNPYMIQNGKNGFLFPMRNAERLASQIHRIACDPELYQKLSDGARARFLQELNAERMTRQTEALYEKMLQKKQKRMEKTEILYKRTQS